MRPTFTRIGPEMFRLGNTEFVPSVTYDDSTPSMFRVHMPAEAIEAFPRLSQSLRFGNVVQLVGVDVGSVALTALVAAPAKLVALSDEHVPADLLLEFAQWRGIDDRMHIHAPVDLCDRPTLAEIIDQEFTPDGPDVVIDGLSNDLQRGRGAFEALFPMLRPGGLYLLERWSWDHFILEGYLANTEGDASHIEDLRRETVANVLAAKGSVLEVLLPSLLAMYSDQPGVIDGVTANKHWLGVRRGTTEIDTTTFRLRLP